MRKELQRRFMLLFRHFRHRKYGEAMPRNKSEDQSEEELEDMFKEDLAMQNKIKKLLQQRFDMGPIEEAKRCDEVDQISDFGSEEAEENAKNERISTKEEARTFVKDRLESDIVGKMIRDTLSKVLRVSQFILTLVLRKRFLRTRRANARLQNFFRKCLAKKAV